MFVPSRWTTCVSPWAPARPAARIPNVYIVAIAWLYVVILMAVMQPTCPAAIGTLFGFGLMPLTLFVWIVGAPQRRRARRARETREAEAADLSPVRQQTDTPDHQHTERDQ